jgi:hypothetical protein
LPLVDSRMSLSEQDKKAMLEATRDAAAAFVEDCDRMRRTLAAAPPDRADLRALSNVLRRLLVNREIQEIAAARIGRFIIDSPDEKPMIDYALKQMLKFFASAGAAIRFGDGNCVTYRAIYAAEGTLKGQPSGYDPGRRVPLRVDNFISQRVFYIHGRWIARTQIIQFVANIGSGVHSGSPQTDLDKSIASIRSSVRFSVGDAMPVGAKSDSPPIIEFNEDALNPGPFRFEYTKGNIDPLLVEMLSTAKYFCESQHTIQLEAQIKKELGI